ncbi:MAG: glycosyltransferase family 2 protein [Verrucomicrobia bacterium]|nr:MAG: glycosyltransferase family 2 protein [Verrucomicrobiota bacterium]
MSATENRSVFVVIPAYNEAGCVGTVARAAKSKIPNVVVVDDGSSDQTAAEAETAGAIVLTHLINRGQGAALKTGIDYALACGADIVVTFDSDGQHRAEDIDLLLAPILQQGFDVVLGSRFLDSGQHVPPLRLRALTRQAAVQIPIRLDRMAHASEILDGIARLRLRYCEVPTRVLYTEYSRQKGQRSSAAFRIVWEFMLGKWGK